MRLPVLISVIAVLLQAGPQPNPRQSTNDSRGDYAARARSAVEDELRKSRQSLDSVEIEIIGNPAPFPDHAQFHRGDEPPAGRARLSGRVVTAMWEYASGVRVSLTPAGENPASALSAVTSAAGEFQFPDIAPGEYELRFEGSPDSRKRVTLHEGRKRVVVPLGGSELFFPFTPEDSVDTDSPATFFARVYREPQLERLYSIQFIGSKVSASLAVDSQRPDAEFGVPSILTGVEWGAGEDGCRGPYGHVV